VSERARCEIDIFKRESCSTLMWDVGSVSDFVFVSIYVLYILSHRPSLAPTLLDGHNIGNAFLEMLTYS